MRRLGWIALLAPALLAAQERRYSLDDVAKLVSLSSPQISPDGKSIVFVAERANYETNAWDAQLILLDIATAAQRVLVKDRDVNAPRWSPAGDRIAFLSSAPPDELQQVLVVPVSGGEPRAMTGAVRGVRAFAWRPDGGAIAYIARETAPPPAEKYNDAFEIGSDPYLISSAPVPSHLWVDHRRLTSGAWSLATGLSASTISWSPDGRSIAVVRFATPHSGDTDQSTIALVDAATGATRALTGGTAREGSAAFAPDGKRLAYSYPRDGDPANLDEIRLVAVEGGEGRVLTRFIDRHVTEFAWMPDSRGVAVLGTDGTRSALWNIRDEGSPWLRVPLGDLASVWEMSVGPDGEVVVVGSEQGRPPEIYRVGSLNAVSPRSPPRRLTDFHSEIAGRTLGKTEHVEWDTDIG